jgi:hypothetical protein
VPGTLAHETVIAVGRIIAGRVQAPAVTSLALVLAAAAVAGFLGIWFAVWSLNRLASKRLRWW